MSHSPEFFLTEQEQAQEARFKEKRKHAFHRQCLPNNSSRGLRKRRPVRPELKFHWNARNDTERKIDPENPRPKSCRAIVMFIGGAQRFGLQVNEQQRESHRQLWKDVVKRNRERELQPVYVHCLSHRVTSRRFIAMFRLAAAVSPQHARYPDGPAAFSHF